MIDGGYVDATGLNAPPLRISVQETEGDVLVCLCWRIPVAHLRRVIPIIVKRLDISVDRER